MSIVKDVEAVFEKLRKELVELVGDLHGVHSAVDDAHAALKQHIPVEAQATTAASTTPDTTLIDGNMEGDKS